MGIKNGFTFFAMLILLFSSMLTPAMAMKEKQITEITDQTVYEVVEAAEPVTPIDTPVEDSFDYSIVEDVSITDKTDDTAPAEHISIASYTPNTTNSTLTVDNLTISGYITRPNMSNPVDNATVTLSTPNNANNTTYCRLPNRVGSVQTSTTTNASGFYSLNIDSQIMNAPCMFTLNASKLNYIANVTNITITVTNTTVISHTIVFPNGQSFTYQTNYSEAVYENINRTIQMHANMTAAINTDLINEPYTNYNQTYNAAVTVTNLGDIAADNVTVNLTATNSTLTAPIMVNIGTINGLSSGTQIFAVKAPDNTTTSFLATGVNATDADDSSVKTAYANITIYTQQQAGGDDAELEVSVATNTTYLNATGELMELNMTAWNDGEATALNATPAFYILKDSSSVDYTSSFTISPVSYIGVDLTGGANYTFMYNISTLIAPSGNYTIYAYANATDGNDNTGVNSNIANATFYVNFSAPVILITSPAEGSVKGPSALLSAYTDYGVTMCRYENISSPTINMIQINATHYNATTPAEITSGYVTYFVNCTDTWGHSSEANRTWFADATGPVINLTSPASTTIAPGTIINFTITDAMSDLSTAYWNATNGSSGYNSTTSYTGTKTGYLTINTSAWTGNITLRVWANDTWNNTNSNITSGSMNITEINFTVDDKTPNVTINAPVNNAVYGNSVYINATATDDNTISSVMYRWENTSTIGNWTALSNVAGTNYFNATLDSTGFVEGNYTIRVNATDSVGHFNDTQTVNVILDKTGPSITLNSPASTTISPGTLINFTLTDALSNLSAGYWSATNGTVVYSNTTSYSGVNTGYLIVNTSTWAGNVTLHVWANDTWNNTNDKITNGSVSITDINITIDDKKPEVNITAPITNEWFGDSIRVNANVTDDYGLSTVLARWETNATVFGNWTPMNIVSGDNFTALVNTTGLPQANYTIRINATDIAGNFNDTQTVSIQIDRTPPTVIIDQPISGGNYSRGSITVVANVSDSESNISESATCTITVPGASVLGIYNASTGQCTGAIGVPSTSVPDFFTSTINVSISDNAGNIGYNDTISFSVYTIPTGPTSGGDSSNIGGYVNNETPNKLNLNFTIEPAKAELLSNETAKFTVNIKNTGQTALNNVVIKIYNIAQGDYYTDPKGINLMKGQNGTLELLITPNSLATGTYVIDLRIGNDLFSRGGNITLKVTNVLDYMEKVAAEKSCNDAQAYLMNLSAQGIDTSANEKSIEYAFTKIAEGDYKTSAAICNAVLALTPDQIRNGATPNPFTGFFINTFGPFVAGNLFWILIAAGIVLTSFIGRNQAAAWLAGFKPKGKNGKGGAANGKPAVKETPKAAPKPEAPKAIAPKPEEKRPEAPKKDEPAWKIEWK